MHLAGIKYLVKPMTQIDALQAEIAALTKSLYEAYNKINQLQEYINEKGPTSTEETPKETKAQE